MQDRSIAVWDMQSPTEINLRRVLVGHRAAVNVVDFDQKYIVSASGDRTIKVSMMGALDKYWVPVCWFQGMQLTSHHFSIIVLGIVHLIKSNIGNFFLNLTTFRVVPSHFFKSR